MRQPFVDGPTTSQAFNVTYYWPAWYSTAIKSPRFVRLTTTAKAILPILISHMNSKTGLCCPGQQTLAAKMGLTDRRVRDAIGELVRSGLITRTRRGRGYRYQLAPIDDQQDTGSMLPVSATTAEVSDRDTGRILPVNTGRILPPNHRNEQSNKHQGDSGGDDLGVMNQGNPVDAQIDAALDGAGVSNIARPKAAARLQSAGSSEAAVRWVQKRGAEAACARSPGAVVWTVLSRTTDEDLAVELVSIDAKIRVEADQRQAAAARAAERVRDDRFEKDQAEDVATLAKRFRLEHGNPCDHRRQMVAV